MINFPNNPVDQQAFRVGQINYIWTDASQSWSAVKGFTNTDFLTYNRILDLNPTTATSTITGALVVEGGVGVGGEIWAGGAVYSDGEKLLTAADLTGTINTIVAGTGTQVSREDTTVIIWSTASLQTVTDAGFTTTNSIHIANTGSEALKVDGDVYSAGGSAYYNYKLYTPQVIVSTSSPVTARVGDFWVDPSIGVEYQYVPNGTDGTSTVWIQFIGF